MKRRIGVAALAAFVVGLVGCADAAKTPAADGSATATSVSAGPPWYDNVEPAEAVNKVGAAGAPCELPITFALPAKWKAKPVEFSEEWAELLQQGGATVRCEIDAKPAGSIGFLRVWTIDKGAAIEARQGLMEFIDSHEEITEARYRDTKAGPFDAIEVTFLKESELVGEAVHGRAFVVGTSTGTVLVTLGGMDTDEVEEMLPAYQLVKRTVELTS